MMHQDDGRTGKLLRGALAGLVAGVAASFVMDQFQAAVTALSSSGSSSGDDGAQQEPATQRAAGGIAKAVTGGDLPPADKPLAGQAMHYALGIGLGVAYAVAAEFRPSVTTGFGAAFGVCTATLLDEGAVPAFKLGQAPWQAGLTSNLYAYASHLVFGGTSELVRRRVAATLTAQPG